MEKMLPQKICRIDLWYDCILMSPNGSGELLTEEMVKYGENKTSANIAFYKFWTLGHFSNHKWSHYNFNHMIHWIVPWPVYIFFFKITNEFNEDLLNLNTIFSLPMRTMNWINLNLPFITSIRRRKKGYYSFIREKGLN